jgi:hypothetical protein
MSRLFEVACSIDWQVKKLEQKGSEIKGLYLIY